MNAIQPFVQSHGEKPCIAFSVSCPGPNVGMHAHGVCTVCALAHVQGRRNAMMGT